MSPTGINNEEQKMRAQYLNMRGAQMAQENAGQTTNLKNDRVKGSKKQLVGTIVALAAVIALLAVLAVFRVI